MLGRTRDHLRTSIGSGKAVGINVTIFNPEFEGTHQLPAHSSLCLRKGLKHKVAYCRVRFIDVTIFHHKLDEDAAVARKRATTLTRVLAAQKL